ncbi:MAG TPA: GNAT family N-acetyltransferase [Gemmatimonadales bacterium]|nr:GNAT family N-acetyltransferase [Gemmatimonadales bacterium]
MTPTPVARPRFARYLDDLRTLPGDVRLAWRLEGWSGVRAELAERTLHRLWRSGHLLLIAQELTAAARTPVPAGVEIRELAEEDWDALASILTRRALRQCRAAHAAGRVCLVAWRGPRPIGYTWLSAQVDASIEPTVPPLPPGAAYLWNLWVLPAERSGGVGSALVSARLDAALARGFREGWRMVSPRNTPSLRTVAKTAGTGTRVVGELRYRKLGRRVRTRFTPAPL